MKAGPPLPRKAAQQQLIPDSILYTAQRAGHDAQKNGQTFDSVSGNGSILHLPDLHTLMTSSEKLYKTLKGEAVLPCIEPNFSMSLSASSLGQINLTVEITPDHLNQEHKFQFEIDQSYLPDLISSCKKVINRYGIKRKA